MTKLYKFKVGDKVKWGGVNGVVRSITDDSIFPIDVNFNKNHSYDFTLDGRECEWHTEPTLKLRKFKKKLAQKFKEGDKIIWDSDNGMLECVVVRISDDPIYPICIEYKLDGRVYYQTFTKEGYLFEATCKRTTKPDLKKAVKK